jgi:hypothetical protein
VRQGPPPDRMEGTARRVTSALQKGHIAAKGVI